MIAGFHVWKIACKGTVINLSLCSLKEGQEEIRAIRNKENRIMKAPLQVERCKQLHGETVEFYWTKGLQKQVGQLSL